MTLVLETKNKSFLEHIESLARRNGVRAIYKGVDALSNSSKRIRKRGRIFANVSAPYKKNVNDFAVREDGKIHITQKQWEEMVKSSSITQSLSGILSGVGDVDIDEVRTERLAKHL